MNGVLQPVSNLTNKLLYFGQNYKHALTLFSILIPKSRVLIPLSALNIPPHSVIFKTMCHLVLSTSIDIFPVLMHSNQVQVSVVQNKVQ